MFKSLLTTLLLFTSSLSFPLSITPDYFLTTNISIGSNNQNFKVQLDTGSLPLWINSPTCKIVHKSSGDAPNGPCYGDNFNPSLSSSFINLNTPFTISYDDGTQIDGLNSKDTLTIGNYKYDNFEFGLVNTETYQDGDQSWTIGILGLTPQCCGDKQTSVIQSFYNDNTIQNKLFTLYLPKDINQIGEMVIGNYNSTGNIVWIPVTLGDEAWNFPSITLVGDSKSFAGIADTGTDIMYMPSKSLKTLCKNLNMKFDKTLGCYTACTNTKNVGNFILNFGNNIQLEINTQDNFIYPVDKYGDRTQTSNNCALAIFGDKTKYGYTLGAAVIRQFHTIWDFSGINNLTGRIGFMKK